MYQNLSSSSFNTTLIITVKIENVYANNFNDLNVCDDNDGDANTYIHLHSFIHSKGWFHSTNPYCHHITTATTIITLDAATVNSSISCWLQATRFSHKTLNAVRIRFAFIRLLVMWCESHKSLKSLSFHFHFSYSLSLPLSAHLLISLFISWIFHENRRIFP